MSKRNKKVAKVFNPNESADKDSGLFGLTFTPEDSKLVVLGVPWEVTTSYGSGTSQAPSKILAASHQVDLCDIDLGHFYEAGISMLPLDKKISNLNAKSHALAKKVREKGLSPQKVNEASEDLNLWVFEQTKALLKKGKIAGVLGGDHSTPFGAIWAFAEKYPQMGILHFDAHADLRKAYEGFEYSHASIMYNVMEKTGVSKLVQVGIRDFCSEEKDYITKNVGRITTFFDQGLAASEFEGKPWRDQCNEIIGELPQEVYISFDIDGLDPKLCPNTGTPVPGGLSFHKATYLIKRLVQSGKTIVGFDLNEVAPGKDEWDANVGARMLFKLCGWTLKSQKII